MRVETNMNGSPIPTSPVRENHSILEELLLLPPPPTMIDGSTQSYPSDRHTMIRTSQARDYVEEIEELMSILNDDDRVPIRMSGLAKERNLRGLVNAGFAEYPCRPGVSAAARIIFKEATHPLIDALENGTVEDITRTAQEVLNKIWEYASQTTFPTREQSHATARSLPPRQPRKQNPRSNQRGKHYRRER